jgi:predicted anti-sigma-YlaC factor YlaD
MEITTLIGFAGGLAVLASFAGVASGRTSAHSPGVHAANLAGAAAMVAAGFPAGAWPSVAVNAAWALISVRGLAHAIASRRAERYSY